MFIYPYFTQSGKNSVQFFIHSECNSTYNLIGCCFARLFTCGKIDNSYQLIDRAAYQVSGPVAPVHLLPHTG